MAIAIALLVIALGSVLFHVFTPWWTTPIASNWQSMDDTLQITLVVTGVFFVAINLFVVYTLWRFRHREGQTRRAAYEPENKRLERWLIGITTVGIIGLLAPGLVVYAAYVRPPDDALTPPRGCHGRAGGNPGVLSSWHSGAGDGLAGDSYQAHFVQI